MFTIANRTDLSLPDSIRLSILMYQDKMSINEYSTWTLWYMLTELFIKHLILLIKGIDKITSYSMTPLFYRSVNIIILGLNASKPVFGFGGQQSRRPACSSAHCHCYLLKRSMISKLATSKISIF